MSIQNVLEKENEMELPVLALGFAGGLLVGWWFLPQPGWAKSLYARFFGGSDV